MVRIRPQTGAGCSFSLRTPRARGPRFVCGSSPRPAGQRTTKRNNLRTGSGAKSADTPPQPLRAHTGVKETERVRQRRDPCVSRRSCPQTRAGGSGGPAGLRAVLALGLRFCESLSRAGELGFLSSSHVQNLPLFLCSHYSRYNKAINVRPLIPKN